MNKEAATALSETAKHAIQATTNLRQTLRKYVRQQYELAGKPFGDSEEMMMYWWRIKHFR